MAQCWVWHINDDHSRLCSGFNIENKPGVPETVFISRCQDYRGQEQRHVPIERMRTWGMGHQNIQKASFQISYDMNQTCSYFLGKNIYPWSRNLKNLSVTPMLGFKNQSHVLFEGPIEHWFWQYFVVRSSLFRVPVVPTYSDSICAWCNVGIHKYLSTRRPIHNISFPFHGHLDQELGFEGWGT